MIYIKKILIKSFIHFDKYYLKNNILTNYQTKGVHGYETLLPVMCQPKKLIETLGVCGYVAIPDSVTGVPDFYES